MSMRGELPRNTGTDAVCVAQTEADHFMKCPGCRQWFDMRALGQVLAYVHDIESA
jgi:CRISPR/Cas system type I-B associated protein Csh2 (Cas7 group RAMP superfamily)